MSRIGEFFRSILQSFHLRRLRRQLRRSANRMASQIDGLEIWLQSSQERLEKAVEISRKESAEIQVALSALSINVEDLQNNQRVYENELAVLREKLNISDKVTIPGIVQSNELLLQQLRALTNIEISKQTAIREIAS